MRVRFIKTFATDRVVFRNGREYDLKEAEAGEYIDARLAEEVKLAAAPSTRIGRPKVKAKMSNLPPSPADKVI